MTSREATYTVRDADVENLQTKIFSTFNEKEQGRDPFIYSAEMRRHLGIIDEVPTLLDEKIHKLTE